MQRSTADLYRTVSDHPRSSFLGRFVGGECLSWWVFLCCFSLSAVMPIYFSLLSLSLSLFLSLYSSPRSFIYHTPSALPPVPCTLFSIVSFFLFSLLFWILLNPFRSPSQDCPSFILLLYTADWVPTGIKHPVIHSTLHILTLLYTIPPPILYPYYTNNCELTPLHTTSLNGCIDPILIMPEPWNHPTPWLSRTTTTNDNTPTCLTTCTTTINNSNTMACLS